MDSINQQTLLSSSISKTSKMPTLLVCILIFLVGVALGYLLAIEQHKSSDHEAITAISPTPLKTISEVVPQTATPPLTLAQLHTSFFQGTYSSQWRYTSIQITDLSPAVCTHLDEGDYFELAAEGDVLLSVCTVSTNDPEIQLEEISSHKFPQDYSYVSNSAKKHVRFGLDGLKGTWLKGVTGRDYPTPAYETEQFEIYIKQNHMFLIQSEFVPEDKVNDLFKNVMLNNIFSQITHCRPFSASTGCICMSQKGTCATFITQKIFLF